MELAIPLIGLGALFVINNQSKKKKETFESMGKKGNYLPNIDNLPQNYPVVNIPELIDTVQEYPNPNQATDKYFNQTYFENKNVDGQITGQNINNVYSLTGNYLQSNEFKHNNMVPFYGGKMYGGDFKNDMAQATLDNMVGGGSQTIHKTEQAPLFKPEDNVQWAFGSPDMTDFYQSRVNPSMMSKNSKPFVSEQVGPGLNQGFSSEGRNGFNSGMEARELWLDKTVDELRIATNPKESFSLLSHEGPAEARVTNLGQIGTVEKNRPDTFFINTQDRWLTTTGSEKGEALRPIQEMGVIRRNDVLTDYTGPAGPGDIQAGVAPENFEPSKRKEVLAGGIGHSTAAGHGPHNDKDNFLRSHTNYQNNRSSVKQPETLRSGFSGAIGAVIAPLMDILKPTRKDETINNVRIYGEAGTCVPKGYVYNPNDATTTTIKETTLYSPNFNINNQKEGIYVNNYSSPELTQRDTTSCEYFTASGGAATAYGDMSYEAAYMQHNNDIKSSTIGNRPNQGGMQIFNQEMNVNCWKQDCNRYDGRLNPAYSALTGMPPSVQTYGAISAPQYYNECQMCDRIQPDILNAFKENPYTHSLTTSV